MGRKITNLFFVVCFLGLLFFPFFSNTKVFGQSASDAVSQREQELRNELAALEREIEVQLGILHNKQRETASIERDIAILNAQISEARLSIRAKNIRINQLGEDIGVKNETITQLEDKMLRGQETLSHLIRETNELGSFTLPEIILSNKNLSAFLVDVDSFATLKSSLSNLFEELVSTRSLTEQERESLAVTQRAEIDARVEIESKKRQIETSEKQKQSLLSLNKKEEATYKSVLEAREARAAEIRSALFALRDSAAIPFGEALEFARLASERTGVRPAFVLAILTQESNLGENVGTCNRPGDPPSKSWKEIMKPTRDHEPYLRITKGLGLDPNTMPLSCPWGNGWGGAMGPAQFIPSTWEIFQDRIANATSHHPPSPWEPIDAITASAIYLSDLGADAKTYSAEKDAACRYYSGRSCDNRTPRNSFYGEGVMKIAQRIQEEMIDPLELF